MDYNLGTCFSFWFHSASDLWQRPYIFCCLLQETLFDVCKHEIPLSARSPETWRLDWMIVSSSTGAARDIPYRGPDSLLWDTSASDTATKKTHVPSDVGVMLRLNLCSNQAAG